MKSFESLKSKLKDILLSDKRKQMDKTMIIPALFYKLNFKIYVMNYFLLACNIMHVDLPELEI